MVKGQVQYKESKTNPGSPHRALQGVHGGINGFFTKVR
jgi:hypothetical protein